MATNPTTPAVTVVGGGLAGLAAAMALGETGETVEVIEARGALGGRAASFKDQATQEVIDLCQHVSLGCCTNLADFCERAGIRELMRRDRVLRFIGPEGSVHRVVPARWLPAPLHFLPSLARLSFLSVRERWQIARGMWRLMRLRPEACHPSVTFDAWLRETGQSPRTVERYWAVVLVSALSESLDRISLSAGRQVFVDGFLANRRAAELEIPRVPLRELYGPRLVAALERRGVRLRLGTPVRRLVEEEGRIVGIETSGGETLPIRTLVLATPWRRTAELAGHLLPEVAAAGRLEPSPITAVHLWFDRPLEGSADVPHAVLVGRLSQWVFRREADGPGSSSTSGERYYQAVISASRSLAGRDREEIVAEVCRDLATVWPVVSEARLVRSRLITEPEAVFAVRPGSERLRPTQRTSRPELFLAGDWTDTGWPATMEGAVRSGYLAAEAVLQRRGIERRFVAPDLGRGWLVRMLVR